VKVIIGNVHQHVMQTCSSMLLRAARCRIMSVICASRGRGSLILSPYGPPMYGSG
jgi:hypothetical protein